MKTKQQWLLAAFLVLALVQYSCYTPNQEEGRAQCEAKGGVWHDEVSPPWCEYPANPIDPLPDPPAATDSGTPAPDEPAPAFDIRQCDASAAIDEVVTLVEDSEGSLGRSCSYTLQVSNRSDQRVYFYYYWNSENSARTNTPEWLLHILTPGETYELTGSGVYWVDGTWGYIVIDKLMAVYYIDGCRQNIDYNDRAALEETFAWGIQTFCEP